MIQEFRFNHNMYNSAQLAESTFSSPLLNKIHMQRQGNIQKNTNTVMKQSAH